MAELRVYKYTLIRGFGESVLALPLGARVLSTGYQDEDLQLWALVDPEAEEQRVGVCVLPTGFSALPKRELPWSFIGTAQTRSGIVAHVFVQWSPRYGHPLLGEVRDG